MKKLHYGPIGRASVLARNEPLSRWDQKTWPFSRIADPLTVHNYPSNVLMRKAASHHSSVFSLSLRNVEQPQSI